MTERPQARKNEVGKKEKMSLIGHGQCSLVLHGYIVKPRELEGAPFLPAPFVPPWCCISFSFFLFSHYMHSERVDATKEQVLGSIRKCVKKKNGNVNAMKDSECTRPLY